MPNQKQDYVKMILNKNKSFMGGSASRSIASPKSAFNPGKMSVSRIGGNASSGNYETRSQMSGSSTGSMGGGLASRFSLALSRVIDSKQILVDSSNLKQNEVTESTTTTVQV